MDEISIVIVALVLVGLIFVGPWVLVWRGSIRRRRDRLEDQARWSDVTARVYALERELQQLRSQGSVTPASQPVSGRSEEVAASPAPPISPMAASPNRESTQAEAYVTRKLDKAPVAPAPVPPSVAPPPPLVVPSVPAPQASFASTEIPSSLFDRFRSALDIEEMLGTDWLNKLGIVLLVLGVAFFLAYQLKTMGPAGKVLVGFVTGCVLLGGRHLVRARRSLPHSGARRNWRRMGAAVLHHVRDVSRAGGARAGLAASRSGADAALWPARWSRTRCAIARRW